MKRLLAILVALGTTLASAAFDLQQVSRFNSSALCPTSFTAVAAKPGGASFIVVGGVAGDVLVVEYDRFGGVVRSAIWDSPLVQTDVARDVFTYSDGKVLVSAGRFLLQFSPTLTLNWEIERTSQFNLALDGNGNAYVLDFDDVEVYNSAGNSVGATTLATFEGVDIVGIPGETVPGAIVVGKDSSVNRACAIRVSSTATVVSRNTSPIDTSGPQAMFFDVVAEVTGSAVMVGRTGSGGGQYATLSSAGTLAGFAPSALSSQATRVLLSGSEVIVQGAFGLARLNKTTGVSSASVTTGQVDALARIASAGRLAVMEADPNLSLRDETTLNQISGEFIPARLSAGNAISAQLAAFVGSTADSAGVLCLTDGVSKGVGSYRFFASPRRLMVDSSPVSDGSVVLVSNEDHGEGDRVSVARYRANGTIQYARTIAFTPHRAQSLVSEGLADGSVAVAGRAETSGLWLFTRMNAQGTVLASRTFTDLTQFEPQKVSLLPDGSTLVYGVDVTDRLRIFKLSSSGQIVAQVSITDGQLATQALAATVTNGGLAFVAYLMSNNTVTLRLLNTTTLATQQTTVIGTAVSSPSTRVALDAAGAIVYAYIESSQLRLERRSATTLSLIHSRTVGPADAVQGLAISPNGNTICSVQRSGDDGLFYLGVGNFPDVIQVALASTVTAGDVAVDTTNFVYVQGREGSGFTANTYAARYLANGIRSAQRRTAGTPREIHVTGGRVWVTGEVGTRKKGRGPYAARYSL